MKYAVWTERHSERLTQSLYLAIHAEAAEQGHELGGTQKAWIRDARHSVEISTEFKPGYRPIWYWEAK